MYPGSPWYAEGVEEYTYNPERAKELLAEAGYPDGFTTTFVCPTSGSGNMFPQIMNEYIQKCAEEVGIHIELDMSESERVWDVMKVGFKDEYADVGALNTSFYTMFPNVFQKFAGTGGSFNTGKYSNPESVSYTHLDVYKRQQEARRRDCRGANVYDCTAAVPKHG